MTGIFGWVYYWVVVPLAPAVVATVVVVVVDWVEARYYDDVAAPAVAVVVL